MDTLITLALYLEPQYPVQMHGRGREKHICSLGTWERREHRLCDSITKYFKHIKVYKILKWTHHLIEELVKHIKETDAFHTTLLSFGTCGYLRSFENKNKSVVWASEAPTLLFTHTLLFPRSVCSLGEASFDGQTLAINVNLCVLKMFIWTWALGHRPALTDT